MSFTVTLARYGLRSVDLLHEGSLRMCGVGDKTCSMFFGGQHTMRRVTPGALLSPSTSAMPCLRDILLVHGGVFGRHEPPVLMSAIFTGGAFPFMKKAHLEQIQCKLVAINH